TSSRERRLNLERREGARLLVEKFQDRPPCPPAPVACVAERLRCALGPPRELRGRSHLPDCRSAGPAATCLWRCGVPASDLRVGQPATAGSCRRRARASLSPSRSG